MSISASAAAALMSAIGDNDENQGVSNWLDTGYEPLNEIISGDPLRMPCPTCSDR